MAGEFGPESSGGLVDLTTIPATAPGDFLDFNVGADGVLLVEFFESFDDGAGEDALFTGGIITVEFVVPEPTSIGLAGIAGLGMLRRRRRA